MTLRYLLDTNICLYIAKQHPKNVLRHFEQLSVGDVAISVISYGELIYGVEKSQHVQKNSQSYRTRKAGGLTVISSPKGCHG